MFRPVGHGVDEGVCSGRKATSERARLFSIECDDVRAAPHKIGWHRPQAAMRNGHCPAVVEQMGRRGDADLPIPTQNKSVRHAFGPQYRG